MSVFFSGFVGNESEHRTNKSPENRALRAICLSRAPIHSIFVKDTQVISYLKEQTLHEINSLLPNLTLLTNSILIKLQVSIEHLRQVWYADRENLLLRTPGPVPPGTT